MTVPLNPELAAGAAPLIIPEDQQSHLGWTHPRQLTERSWLDFHKAGTIGATLAATALLSSIYTNAGTASDKGLPLAWHNTDRSHNVVTSYDPPIAIPKVHKSSTIYPAPTQTVTSNFSVNAVNMPDVKSFDLNTTPEAQVILTQTGFDGFIANVVGLANDGWDVSNFTVNGVSSDETGLDTNAGIGTDDPKNLALAQQYQDFVKSATLDALKEQGVTVPVAVENGKPHEAKLNGDQIAEVDNIRNQMGFKNNLELIKAYKNNPASFSKTTLATLRSLFDVNRGANVSITLQARTGEQQDQVFETTTSRCITTFTTRENDVVDVTHPKHQVTFAPILIPIGRVRRSKRNDPIEPEAESDPPTPAPLPKSKSVSLTKITTAPEVAEDPTALTDPDDGPDPGPYLGDGYGGAGHIPKTSKASRQKYRANQLRARRAARANRQPMSPEKRRALRFGGLGLAAAMVGFALIGVRGDAGYCPDPENHAIQKFRWTDLPEYLNLRMHIEFTDIDSPRSGDLLGSICVNGAQQSPDPGKIPQTPPEPTCDTRQILIRDGKVISDNQTHYQGAITTSTTQIK